MRRILHARMTFSSGVPHDGRDRYHPSWPVGQVRVDCIDISAPSRIRFVEARRQQRGRAGILALAKGFIA